MKYIEELVGGDSFLYDNTHYVLTSDFKKDGKKLAYSLDSGFAKWFEPASIVEKTNLYILDNQNNILPIKEHKKENYNV